VRREKIPDPNEFMILDHVRLKGQDYSLRKLQKFTGIGARLEGCRFTNAIINDAGFGDGREMSEYVDCNFDGAHIDHMAGHARFVKCSFLNVRIEQWLGQTTELIDCTFSGRIGWAVFFGKIPIEEARRDLRRERNEFRGNDFSNLNLIEPDFRGGINLLDQRLPSGPEYFYVADAVSAFARLRNVLENWDTDAELRKKALSFIHPYELIVKGGQKQLLLRPDSFYGDSQVEREAADKIFAVLGTESE
jgi:hypothetical protein